VAPARAPRQWAEDFRFGDFTQFREAAQACLASLTSLPAYGTAAAAIFGDLKAQNVRYVEISLDVVRLAAQPLPLDDVVTIIQDGRPGGARRARDRRILLSQDRAHEHGVRAIEDAALMADLARVQANAFRVAAMPEATRAAALREIAALLGEIESGRA
jgi:adenosine deaminase